MRSLTLTILPNGGVEEWRTAYWVWQQQNPLQVHTYSDLITVERWLGRLTVTDRENHPELLKMGAYKLVTEYGF